jgi:hypothetical protein
LSGQFKHVSETFYEGGITGLLGAIIADRVQSIKNIPASIRAATELEEK